MSDTYTYPYQCSNCDKTYDAKIPRGTRKPDAHECPNCGCSTGSPRKAEQPDFAKFPTMRNADPLGFYSYKYTTGNQSEGGAER